MEGERGYKLSERRTGRRQKLDRLDGPAQAKKRRCNKLRANTIREEGKKTFEENGCGGGWNRDSTAQQQKARVEVLQQQVPGSDGRN
jgi:hypothetical protein